MDCIYKTNWYFNLNVLKMLDISRNDALKTCNRNLKTIIASQHDIKEKICK